ncbi:MAG: purine-nucleoside phosphorylase [Bdellovibrionota bacterium]
MEDSRTTPTTSKCDSRLSRLKDWLNEKNLALPYAHVVLGSGLALPLQDLEMKDWSFEGEISFSELPGMTSSTAPGHKGTYRFYKKGTRVVSFQVGRLHGFEGNKASDVVKPVLTLADLGVEKFIITNAAGSLQTHMKAGSVMLINDHVNFTGLNPLTGPNDESLGPRFPDMSQIYSPRINKILEKHLNKHNVETHFGIYIGVNGPSFETPAEINLFSNWGMGSVGMSTVFEAIALKHRSKEIGGLSFLANMGAGLGEKAGDTLTGEEVLEAGRQTAPSILKAIFESLETL